MFEAALKGTRVHKGTRASGKVKGWRTFSGKDASRWKREGSVSSMVSFRKLKSNKWWK